MPPCTPFSDVPYPIFRRTGTDYICTYLKLGTSNDELKTIFLHHCPWSQENLGNCAATGSGGLCEHQRGQNALNFRQIHHRLGRCDSLGSTWVLQKLDGLYIYIHIHRPLIQRSLEVKLPTIWTDEKQRWEESEKRREEKRRRKKIKKRKS